MKYISAVVVMQSTGADFVSIATDLPNPVYPLTGPLDFTFKAAHGTGAEYVREHFGIEATVVGVSQDQGGCDMPAIMQ